MGKKVVVTGATGLLGRQVAKAFSNAEWDVVGTGFSRARPPAILKVDLGDKEAVTSLLDDKKPDVVVHCAAERFPDKCDADPEATKRLNVEATKMLGQETKSRNIFLIYISTDYVFDGKEGGAPYEATSQTNPPNFYGETKLGGEKAVLETSDRAVVLRVPVLYGEVNENKESAVNVLVDAVWNKSQKTSVDMDHWSIRYPTNTADVGRVIKDIAEKYAASEDPSTLPEILQFSSEDRFTKYEICQKLGEILGLPIDHLKPISTVDPNASTVRPYDCHLSTKSLQDIGISVETVPFDIWWQREFKAYKH